MLSGNFVKIFLYLIGSAYNRNCVLIRNWTRRARYVTNKRQQMTLATKSEIIQN